MANSVHTNLSASDISYIQEMAAFYNITEGEAYLRFINGNIEGFVLDEDDLEEEY